MLLGVPGRAEVRGVCRGHGRVYPGWSYGTQYIGPGHTQDQASLDPVPSHYQSNYTVFRPFGTRGQKHGKVLKTGNLVVFSCFLRQGPAEDEPRLVTKGIQAKVSTDGSGEECPGSEPTLSYLILRL